MSEKKWSEIVLEARKEGKVVCILLPDKVGTMPVEEMVKQPVEGLLWDLNRSEEVCLSFMDKPEMLHWVNNFAVAMVIRELYRQRSKLEAQVEDAHEALQVWIKKYNRLEAQVEALQKKLAHERGCDECWKEHGKFGTCGSDCLMTDALLEATDE